MMDVVCSPIILTHDDTPYSYPSLRMIQHWKHEHYTAWCIYRDKTYLVSRRLRRWWWENDGLSHFIQMNVAAISNIRQWCTATTSADAEIASTGVRFVKSAASVLRTAIGVRQGWKCIYPYKSQTVCPSPPDPTAVASKAVRTVATSASILGNKPNKFCNTVTRERASYIRSNEEWQRSYPRSLVVSIGFIQYFHSTNIQTCTNFMCEFIFIRQWD